MTMAAPQMSGAELGGRLIGLESLVLAIAAEVLAGLPQDKVDATCAKVKDIAHSLIDALTPDAGPLPPIIKQLEQHADAYVDQHIDSIMRQRAKLLTAAANASK